MSPNSYENFQVVGCLISDKPLDFGADPDEDQDTGIFDRILLLRHRTLRNQLPWRWFAVSGFFIVHRVIFSATSNVRSTVSAIAS